MTGATGMYERAGVDIEAGNEAVRRIASHAARTARPEVLTSLGGFGAGFALDVARFRQPVLVSATDGVGTKLKIACALETYDTIGIDAVAMCVNDLVVMGAEPLFFLDYLATGSVDPAVVEQIVAGVADGCELAGCSLVGGETAEMPGMYAGGEFDIAGFAVGVVERDDVLGPDRVQPGDCVIGIASTGVHSNGFSLVRALLDDTGSDLGDRHDALVTTLGEALLAPTRIYVAAARELARAGGLRALAHITGGGLVENVPRSLPDTCDVRIACGSWTVPAIFDVLRELGGPTGIEAHRVFNMGIGMVAIVAPDAATRAIDAIHTAGDEAWVIGEVVPGSGNVMLDNLAP